MTTNVEHDLANYQSELWQMADTLRGSMDASEYKHVVLGLIFLKYISDAFKETHAQLELERETALTLKTRTSTVQPMSSGFPPQLAGRTFRIMHGKVRLADL